MSSPTDEPESVPGLPYGGFISLLAGVGLAVALGLWGIADQAEKKSIPSPAPQATRTAPARSLPGFSAADIKQATSTLLLFIVGSNEQREVILQEQQQAEAERISTGMADPMRPTVVLRV